MASFLSAAQSYLNRTQLSSNYTIDHETPPANVGLWRVHKATRNTTGQVVSVWVHSVNAKGKARERVVEVLKKEASSLSRLRHPCILEVVEPLEETRSELTFATEPVVASLYGTLVNDGRRSPGGGIPGTAGVVELDEVEIQKGLLQVARGLQFLHDSAKLVHSNLTPDAILINAKGDWKIGGFGFGTYLNQPDGSPTPWTFPDYDPSLPPQISKNFDYMAPEYGIDEQLLPANDLYALGCLVFAVHSKGRPPFYNHNSVQSLRQNVDQLSQVTSSASWQRLGSDVRGLLSSLITRYPSSRLTAATFQQSSYFNNILVSTLKFLERESFASRTKEEKGSFLKGLQKVLPQFSDRVQRRKVLPSLLETMQDRTLLPFILPNVFLISQALSSIEFMKTVLPKLKPIFTVQDPPQSMLILLDNITLFRDKTSPTAFREDIMPLVYAALEAELPQIQERALKAVPQLCEYLEYSHVKETLFPKISNVFSKTKVLSVKCNTLICFHSMVPVLDKYTLTEKLAPVLARIKTKEPSVMIATLAVHEAMSAKVDREALATMIIPQLWTMSMGPLLNADQFARFMKAVKEMGARVEDEHLRHLREVKRLEEHAQSYSRTASTGQDPNGTATGGGGDIDFETLVRGNVPQGSVASDKDPFGLDNGSFVDSNPTSRAGTPALSPTATGSRPGSSLRLGAKPMPSSAFNSGAFLPDPISAASVAPKSSGMGDWPAWEPMAPSMSARSSSTDTSVPALSPPPSKGGSTSAATSSISASSTRPIPNYNLSLSPPPPPTGAALTSAGGFPPLNPTSSSLATLISSTGNSPPATFPPPLQASPPSQPTSNASANAINAKSQIAPPPGWSSGSVLQPTKTGASAGGGGGGREKNDLGEFDPFA